MLKRQKKHIDKEQGKTKHEAPRSVNHEPKLKTILCVNVVLEILIQCDTNINLKLYIYMGQ